MNIEGYEECARCGFDHELDPVAAQAMHQKCTLCQVELDGLGIGNGPDHNCEEHQGDWKQPPYPANKNPGNLTS